MVLKKLREAAAGVSNREIQEKVENMNFNQIKKEAAAYIAGRGKIKLPQKVRAQFLNEKKKQLMNLVKQYVKDSTSVDQALWTKLERLFEQKPPVIKIDPLARAEAQLPQIAAVIKEHLPLQLEILTVKITVPGNYGDTALSTMKKQGEVTHKEWLQDGSLEVEIRVPTGSLNQVKAIINNLTRGNATFELVKQ